MICTVCQKLIQVDDLREVAGNETYHAKCWENLEEEMENANLQDFDETI